MVFSNINTDPKDTLQLAETESTLWMEAHTINKKREP